MRPFCRTEGRFFENQNQLLENEIRNNQPNIITKNKKRLYKNSKNLTIQMFTTFLINQIACTFHFKIFHKLNPRTEAKIIHRILHSMRHCNSATFSFIVAYEVKCENLTLKKAYLYSGSFSFQQTWKLVLHLHRP